MRYTTIMVDKEVKALLDALKLHPKEPYREELKRILTHYTELVDLERFVHRAQLKKMEELWLNEKDEVWENI